jgi:hypothetical protein
LTRSGISRKLHQREGTLPDLPRRLTPLLRHNRVHQLGPLQAQSTYFVHIQFPLVFVLRPRWRRGSVGLLQRNCLRRQRSDFSIRYRQLAL